jgi:starch synthase
VEYSDGVIIGSQKINKEIADYVGKTGKPVLDFQGDEQYLDAFSDFYDKILIEEPVVSR